MNTKLLDWLLIIWQIEGNMLYSYRDFKRQLFHKIWYLIGLGSRLGSLISRGFYCSFDVVCEVNILVGSMLGGRYQFKNSKIFESENKNLNLNLNIHKKNADLKIKKYKAEKYEKFF